MGWNTIVGTALVVSALGGIGGAAAAQRGPAVVSRPECNPSIREGLSGRQNAGLRQVTPLLGLVPASYAWFGGILRGIGSVFQPENVDPTSLGYRSDQRIGFDVFGAQGYKRNVSRTFSGAKGIGGKNVTDTPQLGVPGRQCPGDPFWVGFLRLGNVEIPPPYQFVHYNWDCFCRYDEMVACPTGLPPPVGIPVFTTGPNLHRVYGGIADYIPCYQCFGTQNIRKHDYLVGTQQGPHFGYPNSFPADTGYQECLRQSVESYAGSGPGGQPRGNQIYGL